MDISFASDPEIKFPVVIVSSLDSMLNQGPGGMSQPYPPVAYGGPSNSDFPPPAACFQPPPHQPAYGPPTAVGPPGAFGPGYSAAPPLYPPRPGAQPAPFATAPVAAGPAHYSPMPQNVSPYGPPTQSSSRAPVLHPPPPPPPPPQWGPVPPQGGPVPPQGGPVPPQWGPVPPPPAAPSAQASAPMFDLDQYAPPSFDSCYTAPTFNMPSQMPGMGTDFLSQQNEEPPSYLSMFPSATTDKPPTK